MNITPETRLWMQHITDAVYEVVFVSGMIGAAAMLGREFKKRQNISEEKKLQRLRDNEVHMRKLGIGVALTVFGALGLLMITRW
jgi:hypothetical protein